MFGALILTGPISATVALGAVVGGAAIVQKTQQEGKEIPDDVKRIVFNNYMMVEPPKKLTSPMLHRHVQRMKKIAMRAKNRPEMRGFERIFLNKATDSLKESLEELYESDEEINPVERKAAKAALKSLIESVDRDVQRRL